MYDTFIAAADSIKEVKLVWPPGASVPTEAPQARIRTHAREDHLKLLAPTAANRFMAKSGRSSSVRAHLTRSNFRLAAAVHICAFFATIFFVFRITIVLEFMSSHLVFTEEEKKESKKLQEILLPSWFFMKSCSPTKGTGSARRDDKVCTGKYDTCQYPIYSTKED